MLDIKRIRQNPEEVQELLRRRGDIDITPVLEADEKRRKLITRAETLKAQQNSDQKQIPILKKEGRDASALMAEMKKLSDEIKEINEQIDLADGELRDLLLSIPNTPNPDICIGRSDADNREVRRWGTPRKFDFEFKAHWDLGTDLDILDFERAVKISGARFSMFKGLGARLERAIQTFMLTTHTTKETGAYTEVLPPLMVNRQAMTGTGQLPKFEEDAYKLTYDGNDFFLIPTAEVPVTNIHSGEILSYTELPKYYTAYTPCFRGEAGSAGRDTRGLIRNHQFDKVELVKLVEPSTSYDELEKLTNDAELILQKLNIPYRVVELCTGDIGFSSAKTYDIEVWMPSYDRYVEISSCSNFEDFQARRANLRYRDSEGKVQYLHTLNGSGLAIGRTFAAILENYQNEDGSITIPEVLVPYMLGVDSITKK
ncbi:MAG: serine--tRNA ligase [Eubacteriales bacterium]|nr:serine--tRNA ligase [Eubacteriales bacterium]